MQKKVGLYFTILKDSNRINLTLCYHVFLVWVKFLKQNNLKLILGKDFRFFFNSVKKLNRYTYSGSPHAQTKKGRDFVIKSSKATFGIIFNLNALNENFYKFLYLFLLKYKTLYTGFKISLKHF